MPRDDFPQKLKDVICKRAVYECSNPDCDNLCIGPTETNTNEVNFFGKVAHITAASDGGPRYDPTLTSEQRKSAENAIFLCSNCADMIDKNQGVDYSKDLLLKWKEDHEKKKRDRISSQNPLKKVPENLDSLINQNNERFNHLLSIEGISGAFEFKVILCPFKPILVKRDQLRELKIQLFKKRFAFSEINNVKDNLSLHRYGLYNMTKNQYNSPFGCIWISNDGVIIFQHNYFEQNTGLPYSQNTRSRLQTYALSSVLLSFLDLIEQIYFYLTYDGKLKGRFEANYLKGWWYSSQRFGWPVAEAARYRSKSDTFEPFEFEYSFMDKDGRIKLVEEIFSELLLDFGYEEGFKIDPRVREEYINF